MEDARFHKPPLHILHSLQERSPPSRFPSQSHHRERSSASRALFLLFFEVPGKQRTSTPISPVGSLWREMPISRAFLYISFRAPSKGALPPGSPCRAPTEGDTPLLELHFICFSESPVNEPTSRSPVEMPVSRAFFYTSLAAPPKKDLLVNQKSKSHLSHKVPGIGTPSMITQQGPYGERHSVF